MNPEPAHGPGAGTAIAATASSRPRPLQRLAGLLLVATMFVVIVGEFGARTWMEPVAAALVVAFMLTQLGRLSFSVLILSAIGVIFVAFGTLTRSDMLELMAAAIIRSGSVVAIFVSLLTLRSAVNDIPGIVRSGLYLVSQPPGRRYAALTLGSQLFSHILQYGAVTLLGGLVTSITAREPDGWLRQSRERRMLLAIQRGFVATLCWSPVAFPMIISTTVIRGSSWLGSVPGALGTSVILTFVGWFLDSLFKPQVKPAPPPMPAIGRVADLFPLALLFVALCGGASVFVLTFGMPILAAIVVLVPITSLSIVVARADNGIAGRLGAVSEWLRRFTTQEAPSFSSESMLVMVATFTGLLSVDLFGPVVAEAHLPALPGWLILVLIVWWMPLIGLFGLHPILAASLVSGLLPQPALYDLTPDQIVIAITAGWALSGATSPFTAVTLLVARLGRVRATTVGLQWNRWFLLVNAVALSLWAAFNPLA